jgi:hypothetical protein
MMVDLRDLVAALVLLAFGGAGSAVLANAVWPSIPEVPHVVLRVIIVLLGVWALRWIAR